MEKQPNRWLFRMVHHNNIGHILQNGIHTQFSPLADPNYVAIGDRKLIDQRQEYTLGKQQEGTLGNYIPFYFCGQTPMLLNIKTGHRGITKRKQEEIIFIVCEINNLTQQCEKWFFTDGHAKDALSKSYSDLKDLINLDWELIKSKYWKNTENDLGRMRRKQAEFLVYQHVPLTCIRGLIVKNESRKLEMDEIILNLGLKLEVYLDLNCKYYYP